MRRSLLALVTFGSLLLATPNEAESGPSFPLVLDGSYCAAGVVCDRVIFTLTDDGNLQAELFIFGLSDFVNGQWLWHKDTQTLETWGNRFDAMLLRRPNTKCVAGSGTWDMIYLGPTAIEFDVCVI